MRKESEWNAAAASTTAAAGICFASGRAVAMFFSQTGSVSWIGIITAAVVFGLICGGVCHIVQRTGVRSAAGMCMRLLGAGFGAVAGIVYSILMVFVALAMLNAAGRLMALVLPVRNAYTMGMLSALTAALGLCTGRMGRLAALNWVTLLLCALFYMANALDGREVRFYRSFETVAELEGSFPAAIILGLMLGVLCALVGAGVTVRFAETAGKPVKFSMRCGVILMGILSAANAAMLCGGKKLLSQEMPAVILAARWGKFGFYASITVMFLCAEATFTAIIGGMMSKVNHDKIPC